ncbi:MAG TPA: toll/interleukin-1 receptor domain-containing protein [Stellaceae bacterium]|jgi:hypothetical protein|nr:toll/interleukin-1 receptor domain-containing protein [Stellaceae bacterium]
MSADVFISYSSKDEDGAETICLALEGRGLSCWMSGRDVGPGENFQEAIFTAISSAKVMVLVFTENANNSNEVKKEVALASQHDLVVIPVRIEDVKPNAALAYELVTRQWIDLFRNWEQQIERLSARVAAFVSAAKEAGAPSAQLVARADWIAPKDEPRPPDAHLLLQLSERRHLINLHRGRTAKYEGQGALREELRRLRGLNLVQMKPGKTVAEIVDGRKVDLAQWLELTELGRSWAEWLSASSETQR